MAQSAPWPVELRLNKAEKRLEAAFDNGRSFLLPAEYLRVESPSAEVQGHNPSQKIVLSGKRHVGIAAVEPVGNYAVRIVFDDGHDTGLYSWTYLYELGERQNDKWSAYLAELEKRGLARDSMQPPPRGEFSHSVLPSDRLEPTLRAGGSR